MGFISLGGWRMRFKEVYMGMNLGTHLLPAGDVITMMEYWQNGRLGLLLVEGRIESVPIARAQLIIESQ